MYVKPLYACKRHVLALLCSSVVASLFVTFWKPQNTLSALFLNYSNSPEDTFIEPDHCVPKRNIVFLKTHKCAGSAVQNILMRHAYENQLMVVLPVTISSHYLSKTEPFNRAVVRKAPWKVFGYNIFCHHTIFNRKEIEAIMPSDSVYITILRDPVSLFESLYKYAGLDEYYNMTIEDYAKATKDPVERNYLQPRVAGHLGRNQMLFDLGADGPEFLDAPDESVEKLVRTIEQRFDLVMIAEHFDESLVLLQELLCWKSIDLVVFPVNSRKSAFKSQLSRNTSEQLREWNSADQYLYDHFYALFREKIKAYGETKMRKAAMHVRKLRSSWFEKCVGNDTRKSVTPSSKNSALLNKVEIFQVRSDNYDMRCNNLVRLEIPFTNLLRRSQARRVLRKYRGKVPPNAKLLLL